jgi:hypothetical protein
MSDHEILDYLEKKRGAHTCGRFHTSQLKTYTLPEPNSIRPGFTLLRAGMLGLLLLLAGRPTGAKNFAPVTPAIEMTQHASLAEALVATLDEHWISGVVRDEFGVGLPGASIYHKGTKNGTVADAEGRFKFPYKLKTGDILTISFLGYTSIDYVVPENVSGEVTISLGAEYMLTGDLVIDTPYEEASETPDAPGYSH